jgi:hypothetical protein
MRAFGSRSLSPLLLLLATTAVAPTAKAADVDLTGTRKLVFIAPFMEIEVLIADVKEVDGELKADVKSFQLVQAPKLSVIQKKDDTISFNIIAGENELGFTGKATKDGTYLGTLSAQGTRLPARFEATKNPRVSPPDQKAQQTLAQNYGKAIGKGDLKSRVKDLQAMIAANPSSALMSQVYLVIFRDAESAGLSDADVSAIVKEFIDGSKAYGEGYASDTKLQVIRMLAPHKVYNKTVLALAKEADQAPAGDVSTESRAEVAKALASAAEVGGEADVAKAARAKADKLNSELDAEYHKNVPPFKPDASSGVTRKSDKVLLMELFTGAQCPPCVAADVAFDGLIQTYKPSEIVFLQYHLHIPGPDPMTNADSNDRVSYYPEFQGTPSVFFDGTAEGSGGGGMGASKSKYESYRKIIDRALANPSGATVNLKVSRDGDAFKVSATAEARPEQIAKDSAKVGGSKLKLRLAVIEDQIRYTGSNKLRFHHHVVRDMPGGAAGQSLKDGKVAYETTIKVADLRKDLEKYLSEYQKSGAAFPNAAPLELSNLSVVAFVQDDGDKSVLNAVMTPLGDTKANP